MKQKIKSAMTIMIAIQSAIEIAKFLKKSYKWLTTPQPSAEEVDETKQQTTPANDQIRED